MLAEPGLGVGYLITRDDQTTLDLRRRTIAFTEFELLGSRAGSAWLSCETEFQVGSFTQDTLGFSGVLHAWQLNHNAVGALALNDRLGHAQLVDAVTYRGQVLLDGILADFGDLGRAHCKTQHGLTVQVSRYDVKIVEVLADQRTGLFAGSFV